MTDTLPDLTDEELTELLAEPYAYCETVARLIAEVRRRRAHVCELDREQIARLLRELLPVMECSTDLLEEEKDSLRREIQRVLR